MAQSLKDRIVHFHNETNSNAPSAGDLARGELGLNLVAKKIYTKDHTDAVVELGGGAAGLDLDSALRLSASGQMLVGRMHVLDTTGETPATTTIDAVDYDTVSFAAPTSPSTNDRFLATVDGPYLALITGSINGDTNAVVGSGDLVVSGIYDGTTWQVVAGASGPPGPAGATGADGAAGTNGTNGTNGTDGTDTFAQVVSKATNDAPDLGGSLNIYPDAATVNISGLANNDVFTVLVSAGEDVSVDGTTYAAAGGNANREPIHFAKISGVVERLGGN